MQKIWNVRKYKNEDVEKIKERYHVSDIKAKMLLFRDIDFEDIDEFLNGRIEDLKDPYKIKDMDKLIQRIDEAIENDELICIYGDYDVDGVTSITVLYKFLKNLGAKVMYYLPDRLLEGYGVNNEALSKIKDKGASLVITVDCGITAVEETEYAKKIGLDICITDHHECGQVLPDAIAVVDPKRKDSEYDFRFFAGVGVAFKTIIAFCIKHNLPKEEYLKYIDIVAVGTISDIVPLIGENRIISKYGLKYMAKTNNIGLKALMDITGYKEVDSMMVSFGLAPRINACGRMSSAYAAVKLLLEEDKKQANMIALKLDELNNERKNVEKLIYDDAINIITNKHLENKNSFVLYNPSWHNGVIGIVASRLVAMYYKPVILLTKENGIVRGSGRCPQGFSIYDALTECEDTLIQFGGHELAAGLSIDESKINDFTNAFERVATREKSKFSDQIINVDTEINLKNLNSSLIKDIRSMKPYGQSNPQPIFEYKNLKVVAIRTLKEDKHLKLLLKDNTSLIEAIGFSMGDRRDSIRIGNRVDIIGAVELNTFNNPPTIQFVLQDLKKSVE